MEYKKTANAVRGVAAGFIFRIISMLFPFIIRTVILMKLGEEYIGLSGLFTAVLNVLNLAELGFTTAVVFSMYKPIADDDNATIKALLNAYRKIYRIVALIVLAAGLCVMPFLKYLIKGSYPADINLYALFAIYLANTVIGYSFFAYKSSLLTAHQRMDVQSGIQSGATLLMYTIQIILLYAFKNYYVYAIALPCCTLLQNVMIGVTTKKLYPQYVCEGSIDKSLKAAIKSKVSALVIHRVGSIIQGSIDTICISAFLGITICSRYNNYMYISSAIQGFVTVIFNSIVAGIGNHVCKESVEKNYKLFKTVFFVNALIVAFCASCLITLYQPFMRIWSVKSLGNTLMMLDFPIVIAIVLLFYVNNVRQACSTFREALGLWDHDKVRPLFISLFNLTGTLISAYYGSLLGIILSTVGAYFFVSMYWETKILFKYYFKKSCANYFLRMFVYSLVAVAVSCACYFVCGLITIPWLSGFLLKLLVCVALSVALLMIIYCKTPEFAYCFAKLRRTKMLRAIKTAVKKFGLFHIRNQKLWELNRQQKVYDKLNKKYGKFAKTDYALAPDATVPKKVWFCWLQGIENAPKLIKACYESLIKNLPDYEIIVITENNMNEYVEIPDYVLTKWKNKVFSNTHFSDILRIALLSKFGGVWIDSTVLCTGKMPKYIEDSQFFVYSSKYKNDETIDLSSWFIYSVPNHPIILQTRDLLYEYWAKEKKLKHYYVLHMLMTMIMRANPKFVENMPFITNIDPHTLQFVYLFKEPKELDIEHIKNLSAFHKLSYKFDKSLTEKENTNYRLILDGKF